MKPLVLTKTGPTSVRITREFDAPLALVWRAHVEPELVKRWMTGPPGHSLPVCEIDLRVGGTGRYVWKNAEFEMGMTATFLEVVEHERLVFTEAYDFAPDNPSTVTTTFAETDGRTRVTIEIEYDSEETRDAHLAPGFEEGYEASYSTLDALLAESTE